MISTVAHACFGSRYPNQTEVSVSIQGSNRCQKQKISTRFRWSEYGELKTLRRTSLASLEAEIKPFYSFWQLFDPMGLGIRTRASVTEQWLKNYQKQKRNTGF